MDYKKKENLRCHHCNSIFYPNTYQWAQRSRPQYCSDICKEAQAQLKRNTIFRHKSQGPCPTCGKMYQSDMPKKFCSMKCYHASPAFLEMLSNNSKKGAEKASLLAGYSGKGEIGKCLECGKEFYVKPHMIGKKKFCSTLHYRSYLAKRFDRWIASPGKIAEIQNYDEFMTQEELPCFIENCKWKGPFLGSHLNLAHGILAKDAKKAAGFNLSTGLIGSSLKEKFDESHANNGECLRPNTKGMFVNQKTRSGYVSRERLEHLEKARILVGERSGPIRKCCGCGKEFTQLNPFGLAKFCSISCRNVSYKKDAKKEYLKKEYPMSCANCGVDFMGNLSQNKRLLSGTPVVCSNSCKGALNSQKTQHVKNARNRDIP